MYHWILSLAHLEEQERSRRRYRGFGFLRRGKRKKVNREADAEQTRPQSIYEHIIQNRDPKTGEITPEGMLLPDAERHSANSPIPWGPGAEDGVYKYHVAEQSDEEKSEVSKQLVQGLKRISSGNDPEAVAEVYKLLVENRVMGYIDEAFKEMTTEKLPFNRALVDIYEFLAKKSPDREPVKFAIIMLSFFQGVGYEGIVRLLGLHEEFTYFSVRALLNLLENPVNDLLYLGQRVHGWGRIHVVEYIKDYPTPEVKDWLLCEAIHNVIMPEYIAYDCAVHGDLKTALMAEEIDDELLRSAGEIIKTLLNLGGPFYDILDYEDGAHVIGRYLELLNQEVPEIDHYLNIDTILGYLTENWDEEANAGIGWTPENRDAAIVLTNRILGKSYWRELVKKQLDEAESEISQTTLHAAKIMGIDTWDSQWPLLIEDPLNIPRWFSIMDYVDHERIDQVVKLALAQFPLDEIASGPAMEMGMGSGFQKYHLLGTVVNSLKSFPGKGWLLIAACLQSPLIMNRNTAVHTLEVWDIADWPMEAVNMVLEAVQVEPEEKTKERISQLIRQKGLDKFRN